MNDLFDRLVDKSAAMPQRRGQFLQPARLAFTSVMSPDFGWDEGLDQAEMEYPLRPLEAIRQVETHIHETETIIASPLSSNHIVPPQAKQKAPADTPPSADNKLTRRNSIEDRAATNPSQHVKIQPVEVPKEREKVHVLKAMPSTQISHARPDSSKAKIPTLIADTGPRAAPAKIDESQIQNRNAVGAQSSQRASEAPIGTPQMKINIGKISVTAPQPKVSVQAPIVQTKQPRVSQHNLKEYLGWRHR